MRDSFGGGFNVFLNFYPDPWGNGIQFDLGIFSKWVLVVGRLNGESFRGEVLVLGRVHTLTVPPESPKLSNKQFARYPGSPCQRMKGCPITAWGFFHRGIHVPGNSAKVVGDLQLDKKVAK